MTNKPKYHLSCTHIFGNLTLYCKVCGKEWDSDSRTGCRETAMPSAKAKYLKDPCECSKIKYDNNGNEIERK